MNQFVLQFNSLVTILYDCMHHVIVVFIEGFLKGRPLWVGEQIDQPLAYIPSVTQPTSCKTLATLTSGVAGVDMGQGKAPRHMCNPPLPSATRRLHGDWSLQVRTTLTRAAMIPLNKQRAHVELGWQPFISRI